MPRPLAIVFLLVAGVLSLPLSAAFLDDEGSESWILPVQLVGMAVLGAVVGWATPRVAGDGAPAARRVLVGAVAGLAVAAVGVAVFFLLLNGSDGA